MTFNTGNPIGSTDARDRSDNSENLDLAVNSLEQTFVDRLGVTRDTLEGVYKKSAYYRAGTFDAGYTLTNNRQTLAYGNVEYSWSGAFPKVVAAGSTPETTGGIGAGAWVDRTDETLRGELIANGNSIYDISLAPTKIGKVIYATDYATPTLAYDATPSGGVLFFPAGVYPPLPPITKPITILGAGAPSFNSGFTGLTGGTIIKGPLTHYADNVHLLNFGVDSGADVCASLYGGAAQEGIVCLAAPAGSEKYGFIGHNLCVICKDSSSAVHAWALERHQFADVNNIKTCYGLHGQAYKVIDSNISNLISISAGGNGVIIKRDENAECRNSNLSNIVVVGYGGGGSAVRTTQQGLTLESRRGDDGVTSGNLSNINISNLSVRGAYANGIYVNGAGVASDTVSDINIKGASIYDCGNGKSEYGRTLRVTYSDCSFSACTNFGANDGVLSSYSKHVNCFAGNCGSGFVGFGANFIVDNCVTDNGNGYGYYAKTNSSCYRTNCRGSESALFGNDSGVYWLELSLINNNGNPVTPALQNSWAVYGSPFGPPQYWLASDGTVRLMGAMKSGVLGAVAFTLPAGFRPSTNRRFVVSATNASTDIFDTLSITSGGHVIIEASGSNNYVSLDGVSFIPNR
jgi:hypothetical protein